MKKFILQTIIFMIIITLSQILLFSIISKYHSFTPSHKYYSEEFNKAYHKERNFELLALGNSKLLAALDKKTLEKKLNYKSVVLGFSSADISVSRLTLESYLEKCIKIPKIVLLEVSWFTFSRSRLTFHQITGNLFLEVPNLLKYLPRYSSNFWKNYTRTVGNSLKYFIKKHFLSGNHEIDWSNWFDYSSPNKKSYKFDRKKFEVMYPTHTAKINKLLLEDFYKIVEICNKYNIKLILFTAPEDKKYSELQKDRKKIKDIFYNLLIDKKISMYLDYTISGKLYNKKYENWLIDSHHISENKLFTSKLAEDIKFNFELQILNNKLSIK